MYLNRTHRGTWVVITEQLPTFSRGPRDRHRPTSVIGVRPAESRFRHINQAVTGITQYPLSRAQRVEFSGGIRRITSRRNCERTSSPVQRSVPRQHERELPTGDALLLGESTLRWSGIRRSSVQPARSSVSGTARNVTATGTLQYSGALLDYRSTSGEPFTLALRGMHYGRYGRDSEDGRMSPLFLGLREHHPRIEPSSLPLRMPQLMPPV